MNNSPQKCEPLRIETNSHLSYPFLGTVCSTCSVSYSPCSLHMYDWIGPRTHLIVGVSRVYSALPGLSFNLSGDLRERSEGFAIYRTDRIYNFALRRNNWIILPLLTTGSTCRENTLRLSKNTFTKGLHSLIVNENSYLSLVPCNQCRRFMLSQNRLQVVMPQLYVSIRDASAYLSSTEFILP